MSDAAVVAIVTGLVTIVTMVIGFLTLWIKLRYGIQQAEDAASKATIAVVQAKVVEGKIDDNTARTQVIVEQTNGLSSALREEVEHLKAEIRSLKSHR